jgi:Ca2+/Na+ antiporter
VVSLSPSAVLLLIFALVDISALVLQVRNQAKILGISTIIPLLMAIFGFSAFLSILGVGSYLGFIIYSFTCKKAEKEKSDVETGSEKGTKTPGGASQEHSEGEGSDDDDDEDHANAPLWKGVGFLLVGGGLIFAFSEPFIRFGISTSSMQSMDADSLFASCLTECLAARLWKYQAP